MDMPGPSSTESGLPVLSTGSPTVRPASTHHTSQRERAGLFIDLDGSLVAIDADDLADQFLVSNAHLAHVVQGRCITNSYMADPNMRSAITTRAV
jgi:hypothetical protein